MNNPTEGYEDTYIIEEERASFSKREWKVLIILRILLLLALIAGLFGIFGGGIIAQRTAEGKHFKIEYPGLARKKTPFKLIISFKDAPDTTQITFDRDYLKNVQITQTMAQAISTNVKSRKILYKFSTGGRSVIVFYLTPNNWGFKRMVIKVGNETLNLNQLIFF